MSIELVHLMMAAYPQTDKLESATCSVSPFTKIFLRRSTEMGILFIDRLLLKPLQFTHKTASQTLAIFFQVRSTSLYSTVSAILATFSPLLSNFYILYATRKLTTVGPLVSILFQSRISTWIFYHNFAEYSAVTTWFIFLKMCRYMWKTY